MRDAVSEKTTSLPEDVTAKLKKRLFTLSRLVGDMKKLLYKDNISLLNNLRIADELVKDTAADLSFTEPVEVLRVKCDPENASMENTVGVYDEKMAAGFVALKDALADVRKAIVKEDNSKAAASLSALNPGASNIKTLADLKPVTSPEEINAMLRNMRIGYLALPVASLLIALFILKFYTLTQERAAEVRAQLEAKRGKV
jgi:hypothetical protein